MRHPFGSVGLVAAVSDDDPTGERPRVDPQDRRQLIHGLPLVD
jgi:hypothetical protein